MPSFPGFRTTRNRLASLLAFALPALCLAAAHDLANSEGTLRFTLEVNAGSAAYRVDRISGTTVLPVLESSPLGIMRTDADFSKGLTLVSASEPSTVADDYTLIASKRRTIHSSGLERTFTLRNSTGMTLTLVVRAYRDGVAFRYGLPGSSSQLVLISNEATGFNVPDSARVWMQPYSKVDVWAPGYEA